MVPLEYSLAAHSCGHRGADYIQHKEKKIVMSEEKPQRVVGISIWGIFLLFLGIVFLLQTLNILPWGLWGTLWRFWPVLIIVIGLGILLRHYNAWLVSLLVLAIFGACLGVAIWQYSPSLSSGMVAKSIPLVINIKSAASNMELDLSELKVTELRLDVDAGNYKVTVPSTAGTSNIEIEANAANIEVAIPDGVAARIQVDANLSALDVDKSRFLQQGDYYMSQDFVSAENRVELEIDCNVGRVQVK